MVKYPIRSWQKASGSSSTPNSYYDTRSIFSEDGNSITRITGQDAMAIRTHSPPK